MTDYRWHQFLFLVKNKLVCNSLIQQYIVSISKVAIYLAILAIKFVPISLLRQWANLIARMETDSFELFIFYQFQVLTP